MAVAKKFVLTLAFSSLILFSLAGNDARGVPGIDDQSAGELRYSDRHSAVSRLVTKFIERNHYSEPRVNDALSSKVFDRFMDILDGNRMFFYASDMKDFERYRSIMDDAVSSGKLDPVFQIFSVYRQRNEDRLAYSLKLLDTEPDFSVEEQYQFDRSESDWLETPEEMDDLWRKRVKNDALRLLLTGKNWPDSREILQKRYTRAQKNLTQLESDDVFESFMNAYTQTLDPHSSYLLPRTSEEYRIQMSLSYEGIGASLQIDDDFVMVMNILPGGPAAIDGNLSPNDRITAVGQNDDGEMVDVVGWRLDDVVELIRGPGGTVVRLQILEAGAVPGSEEKILRLVRDKIKLEAQAAQKEIITIPRGDQELRIGVITVPSFYQDFEARMAGDENYTSTTRDVRRLLQELEKEGIDGLLMDLRSNGGGHLTEAQELSGLFIEDGPVVQVRQTNGRIEILDDPNPEEVFTGPLAVLVNRFSASASEIFAAAIQDYERGVILGQQTFGKGSVQNLYSLDRYAPRTSDPGFGQLTLTIGKFYRVSGESTQHRGVYPDIEMPSLVDATVVGESTRDSALPWDKIDSTGYTVDIELDEAIHSIAQSHSLRAKTDPDFNFLLDEYAAFADARNQDSVSLNLDVRLQQQKKMRVERLARENTRRGNHGLPPLESIEALEELENQDFILQEAAQIVADMAKLDGQVTASLRGSSQSLN
ncbi:MAG: carboxy terminal-processing peptidase [Gammaproteobacteria bacterium]|nr:carboxy terminal-processing peptidase [Gammaproteobacteria bacterium]